MVLLRDDLIATEGFLRVYRHFDCPNDHLKAAFGCAVAAAGHESRDELERWIDICWRDPKASFAEFLKALPPKTKQGSAGGKG